MKRKNKSGKESLALPTNIENATREHIRKSLPSWDAKILARRAERLGISLGEAADINNTPLFMVEIEGRAATEGRTVESLLEEYSGRLRQSTYPTPACLLPDEVVEYADGTLPLERLEHANTCNACATLLAAALPSDEAARDLIETLRATSPIYDESEQVPVAAAAASIKLPFDLGFVERWAGVAFVPAIVLIAMYVISLTIDTRAARQTFLHSPVPWLAALITAGLGLVISERRPVLRSVGVGLAFAAVLASSFLVDFRRSQSADRDLAIKSAVDQLAQFSVTSLENRQVTGKFIDTQHSSGPLRIETAAISNSQVRYVATSKQVPGQAVADIGENGGGEIKWEEGDKTVRQLQFLTGTIHSEGGIFKIQAADGHTYNLPVADLRNVAPNTAVFAVVDPNTASVHSMRILDRIPQEASIPGPPTKRID